MASSPSPTSVRINPMSNSNDGLDVSKFVVAADEAVVDHVDHHIAPTSSSLQSGTTSSHRCSNDDDIYPVNLIRSDIFRLSVLVGKLSASFLEYVPADSQTEVTDDASDETQYIISSCPDIRDNVIELLSGLEALAARLYLDVPTSIMKKMELNRKKYPVELCKGKAGKYTEYSETTGITKYEGQSTLHSETVLFRHHACLSEALPDLTMTIRHFATERTWSKYHLPRNLLLALLGELGELAELFQWSTDDSHALSDELVDKAGQEIADVTIYLIRLVDVCGIDVSS